MAGNALLLNHKLLSSGRISRQVGIGRGETLRTGQRGQIGVYVYDHLISNLLRREVRHTVPGRTNLGDPFFRGLVAACQWGAPHSFTCFAMAVLAEVLFPEDHAIFGVLCGWGSQDKRYAQSQEHKYSQ